MFSIGSKTSFIGVDVGARTIKAVQLRSRRGKTELAAAVTCPRTSGALDVESLAGLAAAMWRQGFCGNQVVVACPPGQLHAATLELPPANSGAPLQRIAEVELRRACKLDESPIEISWWDLPVSARSAGGTTVMAVAATRNSTETVAAMFGEAGLDVVAVDAVPSALARACAPLSRSGLAMAVDLGLESHTVALVHAGRVVYQRCVGELGLNVLCRTISDEMQLGDEETACVLEQFGMTAVRATEAETMTPRRVRLRTLVTQHVDSIARELQSSLSYAGHRYPQMPVSETLLTGGGARIAGIEAELEERFGVTTLVVTPDRLALIPPHLAEVGVSPRHVIAAGLAMNNLS